MEESSDKEIVELALQAGHLLLENGAEISRVEETMERICEYYGVQSANDFVIGNGIFMTAGSGNGNVFAKVEYIPVSRTHLDKVAAVNQLSREIAEGKYTVSQAMEELANIKNMPAKRKIIQFFASAIGSAAFCYLFGGSLRDSMVAFAAGFILYIFILNVSDPHLSKIVGNITGSTLVTIISGIMYLIGIGEHLNYMIIGSIMPLIPGVAFTNAIRDVAGGDYISGSVRMLDALIMFFCIAIGVGFGIFLMSYLAGGALL